MSSSLNAQSNTGIPAAAAAPSPPATMAVDHALLLRQYWALHRQHHLIMARGKQKQQWGGAAVQ